MDSMKINRERGGFTLIELLVVVGIITVIAALLFPVFAGVRERGRRTQCLSNERQLGMAISQYAGDNNDTLFVARDYSLGLGWAGKCYPYVKNVGVFRCPDDASADVSAGSTDNPYGMALYAVSYGFNSNLAGYWVSLAPPLPSYPITPPVTLEQIAAPARTVLLFEVSGNAAPLTDPGADDQSAYGNIEFGTAFDGPTGPVSDATFPTGYSTVHYSLVQYATGNMGGYLLNGATKDWVALPGARGSDPRHGEGANYAACDGHVAWLRPEQISPGTTAEAADSQQVIGGAAGTANAKYALTFSSK